MTKYRSSTSRVDGKQTRNCEELVTGIHGTRRKPKPPFPNTRDPEQRIRLADGVYRMIHNISLCRKYDSPQSTWISATIRHFLSANYVPFSLGPRWA